MLLFGAGVVPMHGTCRSRCMRGGFWPRRLAEQGSSISFVRVGRECWVDATQVAAELVGSVCSMGCRSCTESK